MKFLSVCSGIEAASVAWHPLGWESVAYSEIEPFPCKVLQHHYPDVPNLGDMTKFKEWPDADVNVFVGGTPCQSFSVAGLRKGLDDPRGNLMLTYLAIAKRYRPKWLVWENVPGVLSSAGGRDFGSFLGGLAILGYGFAYRVLDAQYFGVAQRRKRVFVVGYLGDWRPAAAVLFERHSLQGHPAPSREKGKEVAGTIAARFGSSRNNHEECVTQQANAFYESSLAQYKQADVSGTTKASGGVAGGGSETFIVQPIPIDTMNHIGRGDKHSMGDFVPGAPSYTLTKGHSHAVAQPIAMRESGQGYWMEDDKAGTLRAEGENRPSRPSHVIAQPIAVDIDNTNLTGDVVGNLCAEAQSRTNKGMGVMQAIATHDVAGTMLSRSTSGGFSSSIDHAAAGYMALQAKNPMAHSVVAPTLTAANDPSRSPQSSEVTQQVYSVLQASMAVRRLTPVECERLQGFPDKYTDIQPKGKATPDGPRYKALGNSMAVPVMAWIGTRIQEMDAILKTRETT